MSKALNRPRLGRGLNALMASNNHVEEAPPAAHPAAPTAEPSPTERPDTPWRMIAVSAVRANPHQPRRVMDEAALAELADSIKTNGIIQPIVVRLNGNEYELIAGERRLRAAKLANLTEVPALVRQADAYSQAQLALVENIHRTDLNPIERAQAYQSLLDQLGLTQAELATRLGEQRSSVANFLRLLSLTEATRTLLQAGRLTLGHAKILAGISDTMEQERLAQLCADQELTVRNLERLIDPNAPQPTPKALPTQTPAHLKALEASFTQQIGLRVQVKAAKKKGRGRLVIHYNTLDQFDHLTKRLGVNVDDDAS